MKDKQRIDFLQSLTDGYGKGWILRRSGYGRGWRLHETSQQGASPSVREAIDRAMEINADTPISDIPASP
jgi:hypothetical protein